jgi:membrane-associated phospholipid phosphatase
MEATRHALRGLRRSRAGWFELGIFALAYAIYFGVRALTEGKVSEAVDNAIELVHVERRLDLDWEDAVQGLVLGEHALVDAVNAMYIWGHWPLLIVGGFLLFHLGQAEYRRLRTVILLSGALGLVIFAVFPVAPPRLAPVGLQDTVTLHSETYRTVLPPSLVNEYAAMPSFHAGWNLLLGIELFRVSRNLLLRAFGLAMPVAMAFAVVATANHFVLDVVGGALVVMTALLLVTWLERRRTRPSRLVRDVHTLRRGTPRRQRPGHPATRRGAHAAARRG